MTSLRVLIVGSGTVGPLLALALRRQGHIPTLFEATSKFTDVGGGINFAPNGLRFIRDLGLLEQFTAAGSPTIRLAVSKIDGTPITSFTTDPWAAKYEGLRPIGIKRTRMHDVFMEAVRKEGIETLTGKRLKDIQQQDGGKKGPKAVTAIFEDGTEYSGDVLLGCDGLHSKTRELLFGKEPASYTGVVATIGLSTASPSEDPSTMYGFQGDGKFAGMYGIGKGELIWFVGEDEGDANKARESWVIGDNPPEKAAELFRGWGFPSNVVDTVGRSFRVIKYAIFDRPAIPSWTKGRVTLVGDAAHPMAPHLGQGGNTAMEDGGVLSELLCRFPETPEKAFEIYERMRKSRTAYIVSSARQMGNMNSLRNPIGCQLRDWAIAGMVKVLGGPPVDALYSYDYKKKVEEELKKTS